MSSSNYNGHVGHDELYDNAVFSADIGSRMQVPKSIRVGGGVDDSSLLPGSYNSGRLSGGKGDIKYEMKVPERILVAGQDQHIGMKAPPHELVLENSILSINKFPPVRVQTPPRSITVDTLHSNGNHDEEGTDAEESEEELTETSIKELVVMADNKSNNSSLAEPPQLTLTAPQLTEEVFVLRQQIGRLHRRMAVFEREQHQRQQRDALMISIGAVYMVWKVILWLTRST